MCIRDRHSRLLWAWKNADRVKPKVERDVSLTSKLYKNVMKPNPNTFVPAKENPYLVLAIDLVKLGKEKRKIVERFVDTLEKHLGTKESDL